MRGWLIAAGALLLLAGNVVWEAERQTVDINDLLKNGTAVTATVFMKDRGQGGGAVIPPGIPLSLHFLWNGRPRQLDGTLPEDAGHLITGQTAVIHIDPNDVNHWTGHVERQNWWGQSLSAIILAAFAGVLTVVAALLRRQRLRVYQFGQIFQADVLETKANPLAPQSKVARCAMPAMLGQGTFTVSVPQWAARVEPGHAVSVIMVPQRPRLALTGAAYFRSANE